jgi:NitT/TauT family transport system substrate-binding protein
MKHMFILTAVLLALAVGAASCGGDKPSAPAKGGKTRVRVAYVPVATVLPALVAKDEGIFDKNGLDVTLTPIENVTTIPGTLGRQFEIGSSTSPDTIKAVGQGIGVAAVTGGTVDTKDNAVGEIVVPADSPIKSVADLRGKRVATPSVGAAMHVSLLNWLSQKQVPLDSLTAVETPFPTMADQLKAGRVDAVEAVQPFLGLLLQAGNRSIGAPLQSIGAPPVLGVVWIAGSGWARENPEALARWNRSMVEAQKLIARDDKRARAVLQKYTELPPEVAAKVKLPAFASELPAAELAAKLVPWVAALRRTGQFKGEVGSDQLVVGAGGS